MAEVETHYCSGCLKPWKGRRKPREGEVCEECRIKFGHDNKRDIPRVDLKILYLTELRHIMTLVPNREEVRGRIMRVCNSIEGDLGVPPGTEFTTVIP